ncbi:hypothetical protein [uncultured Catenibacterium sp.]|uniref:hypothetical protein n=1 Tax=uncultured Catenibacterium sp. TaxID=286142 RepID=UPI0025D45D3A|nr:hypothetical protein [uncultured Catenibacterium sp.]
MKFNKMIDEAKLKVVDVVDKAELDKHAKELGDVAVGKAKELGDVASETAHDVAVKMDEMKRQWDLKRLKPIFSEDLNGMQYSRLVRIVERDKKFDIEVCRGSIGYWAICKGERWINIFKDSVGKFGLKFYPYEDINFYYVDPTNKDNYIVLDEYFYRLKQARVNGLQKIAQDLGAKKFRVTYMREKSSLIKKKWTGKGAVKDADGSGSVEVDKLEKQYDKVEIEAENSFPGHEPVGPHVRYLKYDQNVQNLIDMRMDTKGPINHQTLSIKLSSTSGLKEKNAAKLDMILKSLKVAGNTTVLSEVQNEEKSILYYEIDF